MITFSVMPEMVVHMISMNSYCMFDIQSYYGGPCCSVDFLNVKWTIIWYSPFDLRMMLMRIEIQPENVLNEQHLQSCCKETLLLIRMAWIFSQIMFIVGYVEIQSVNLTHHCRITFQIPVISRCAIISCL